MVAPLALLCAAEASGDALGARLATALRARGFAVAGVAGPAMRDAGVVALARAEDASALGLVEVAGALPRIARVLAAVRGALADRPSVAVGIDAPGLMSRIGRGARREGVPFVQWVAPQVWAWNAGRAARIGAWADEVACLFPFEPLWLRPHGLRAAFVGHPFAALRPAGRAIEPTVALLPGSRPAEIARHWPVLRAVVGALRRQVPRLRVRVAVAPTVDAACLAGVEGERLHGAAAALSGAHAAVVCSGTASLEVAAAGVPQVVIYQVHPLTWAIGRRVVRVRSLALPNLLAGSPVVPEHVHHLDPGAIARDVLDLLGPAGDRQVAALAPHLAGLDPEGAVDRVAAIVATRARSSPPSRSRRPWR